MNKKMLTILLLVTILSVFNLISGSIQAVDDSEIKKPSVKVFSVVRKDLSTNLSTLGTINFLNKAEVSSEINGILRSVDVDVGDWVEKGQIVANIDTYLLEAKLKEARALLELEEINLPKLENEMEKVKLRVDKSRIAMENYQELLEAQKKLFKSGGISRARLNLSEIDYQQALLEYKTALEDLKSLTTKSKRGRLEGEVKVAKARADLEEIQATLDKCIIKAPIPGIVAEKRKWTGEKTGPNDSVIITILQTREVYADVELNEQNLAKVNIGQEAEVRTDAYPEQVFNGEVQTISPTIDTKSRTVRVRVKVANEKQLLKPGMFARVTIILDKIENALVVPAEAVMQTKEGRHMVFVVIENVAFLREVQPGVQKDNWMEIKKGIETGEQVVTEGKEQLKDLSSVQITESDTI